MTYAILRDKIRLGNKIAVYVPSTINVSKPIDNSVYVDRALSFLSNLFGGASAIDVLGGWLSDKDGLIKEEVKQVYSFANVLTEENVSSVLAFAENLKDELDQESIGLEINGEFYLI